MAGRAGGNDPPQPVAAEDEHVDENTPLLARENSTDDVHYTLSPTEVEASSDTSDGPKKKKGKRRWWVPTRWPSFAALGVLCIAIVVILVLGFIAPQVVKEYALQAMSYRSTSMSLEEYTDTGVNIRIQGDFQFNADLVRKKSVRNLGRFFTSVARFVESKETHVDVSLPEYGAVVVGTASIPPIVIDIRNKHVNHIDILINIEPGDEDGIRRVANDWIDGRLGQLRLVGDAKVALKSGGISLGTESLTQELLIENNQLPSVPDYDLYQLDFEEIKFPDGKKALKAEVTMDVANGLPIDIVVPPIGFELLVPNCSPNDPLIKIAEALTAPINVTQYADMHVKATALIHDLPDSLTDACPDSHKSPLDGLVSTYISGEKTVIYVRGSSSPPDDTPEWISSFLNTITVPVAVPGKKLGKVIKRFKLDHVHFSLPDPLADPDSPESHPQISADVKAVIALPEEMSFPINVDRVRASASVYYKDRPFGDLDLNKWQAATSERVKDEDGNTNLEVSSRIDEAPVNITNQTVFTEVLTNLITSGKTVYLTVKAEVDVQVNTTLGAFVARKIPASGNVPVKPFPNDNDSDIPSTFAPKFNDVRIAETTEDSLNITAYVNFTNPTKYSATIPFLSINLLVNGSVLGQGYVENVQIKEGNNSNIPINAYWNPYAGNGEKGVRVGADLISQYLSGYNVSVTLQTYEGSIPSQPELGRALSAIKLQIPAPKIPSPGDGDEDDGRPHFIRSATMHIFSSTSTFSLASPFQHSTIHIPFIDAAAMYHNDTLGHILFDARNSSSPDFDTGEIEVPPGESETPRLKTEWSLAGTTPEVILKALGGELKLATQADAVVRLDAYSLAIWFEGSGVGVKVRL